MFWDKVERLWARADGQANTGWSCLTFGLLRSWPDLLVIAFGGFGATQLAEVSFDLPNDSMLIQAICFIVLAVIAYRGVPLYRRGPLVIGSAVLMVVGLVVFLLAAACGDALHPLCVAGFVCTVVGHCGLYVLCFEQFGCLSPRQLVVVLAGSTVVDVLLIAFVRSAGSSLLIATLILLPFVICFTYLFSFKDIAAKDMPKDEPTPMAPYLRIAGWLGIFGLVQGVSSILAQTPNMYDMLYLGRLICAAIVLCAAVFFSKQFKLVYLYRVSMPLAVAGFIIMVLWGNSFPNMSTLCLGISSWTFYSVVLIVPCGVAYRMGKSTAWVCSAFMAVLTGLVWLGTQLELWFEALVQPGFAPMLPAGAVIVLLILAAVLLFKESDFSAQWNLINYSVTAEEKEVDTGERCDEIACKHNLSPQEKTVLLLVESGMSNNEISEELFIAPGTVRAHIGRIYKKLGVHSREELDELVKG